MPTLVEILGKYKRGPIQVDESKDGGAILALSLHCLMVKDGFQPSPLNRQSAVAPPADWNHRYTDEWVFEYTRRGYDSTFVLHCSLQAATGKMFVQGREKDSSSNMHNLGLQVEKYVAPERCKQQSWEGVFEGEDILDEMFCHYIAEPLRKQAFQATKAASIYEKSLEWMQQRRHAMESRDVFVPLGIGVSIAIVAAAAAYAYRRRQGTA